ncbi:Protein Y97E10AR.6, partial [Aphelenchoides avenae]
CQLLQLQNDERTFLTAPSQNVDLYRDWLEDFRISEYNGEINILLGYNPRLREIYAKLVPAQVDNHTFWNRYFFKVHVAELDKELQQKPEKGQEKVFDELKVNTETVPRSVEASPAGTEKDETWSIVSNNTSSGDASEPEHVSGDDVTERAGAQTPKAAENGDDWEECEEESTA